MVPVSLAVWLDNPQADAILDLTSSKSGSEPLFVAASLILKSVPFSGHQPKKSRESFQLQVARVVAQRIGTMSIGGETFVELPCQKLLQTFGNQKQKKKKAEPKFEESRTKVRRKQNQSSKKVECQKGSKKLHSQCRKRSHTLCDTERVSDTHVDCPVICPICVVKPNKKHKVFWKRFSYAGHMLKHKIPSDLLSFGKLPCECCGFGFVDQKSLRVHYKKRDAKVTSGILPSIGVGTFACDLCGKRFTAKQRLQRHVQIHDKEHPISDHISAEQRRMLITLEYEQKRSTAPKGRQLCNQCDKSFANAANVRRHIRKCHINLPGSDKKKYLVSVGQSAYAYKLLKKRVTSINDNLVLKQSDYDDNSRFLEEAVDDVQSVVDDRDDAVSDDQNYDCDGSCNGKCVE